jgi:hypothetical protein
LYKVLIIFHTVFLHVMYTRGTQISQQTKSHLKILGAKRVIWNKFHTEVPQMLGAILQNLVATMIRHPGFVHPWFMLYTEPSLGTSLRSHFIEWRLCNHSVNMSAALLDCFTVVQHAVTLFLWSKGLILQDLQKTVRRKLFMQSKVCHWVERVQNGGRSVTDKDHPSLLITSWMMDNFEWGNALIQEDRLLWQA